jgi:hydroxymethylbilane synthase
LLARTQSQQVADAITRATGDIVELVIIKTKGDRVTDRPLGEVGGKGLFTKEIEDALLRGEVDLAVHSMKDMPTDNPVGLIFGAVPRRVTPNDVLVGATLATLPKGAVVGTGSARRRLQLLTLRPDLDVRGIRGNVDTRIAKQRAGEYDAIVLAAAGIARLGRQADIDEVIEVTAMVPAPGQGALAVQCRESDAAMRDTLANLHDAASAVAVTVERAFLLMLQGGCFVPAACYARRLEDGALEIRGFFAREDGVSVSDVAQCTEAEAAEAGTAMALRLRARLDAIAAP